jgi:hypothetical protein
VVVLGIRLRCARETSLNDGNVNWSEREPCSMANIACTLYFFLEG